MHKNKELLDYLKGNSFGGMNFEGFVITDYAGTILHRNNCQEFEHFKLQL